MIEPTTDLDAAVRALRSGGLAVVPTETVHGLAADATNGDAIARIYGVKGRPSFNPLIAHVSDLAMAKRIGVLDDRALALAPAFWPGPLTMVVPLCAGEPVHPLATAGLPTIALRIARGPMTELASRLDRPLVAPSANTSGLVSPTATAHVMADIAQRLDPSRDVVLDGALMRDEPVGLESTIVSPGGAPTLLRPGGIARGEIESVLGEPLRDHEGGVAAPGMLASHYAPRGTVRLDATDAQADEFVIGFGPDRPAGEGMARFDLSPSGDMAEAARNLFAALHAANAAQATRIAVEPVPRHGLGEAINDRLRRAAALRSEG